MRRYNAKHKRKHSTKTYYKKSGDKFYPRCETTIMRSFSNLYIECGNLILRRYVSFRCHKVKVIEVGYSE